MSEHIHSIIIIKNNKGEYLQYFDNRWNSFLFPNCKLVDENHELAIKQYLIQTFNIMQTEKYSINYITDKVHNKFSESAKINKEYHHYFYSIEFESMPDIFNNKTFTIEDKNFKWFSLTELEQDKRIQQVNSDIIGLVKSVDNK